MTNQKYQINDTFRIQFKVKNIMFQNEETGYKILSAYVRSQQPISAKRKYLGNEETICVNGFMQKGDVMAAEVKVTKDNRYGYSLTATQAEFVLPADTKEMMDFLKRRLTGIGATTIKKIVDVYDLGTITEINNNEHALDCINIPEKKKASIFEQIGKLSTYDKLSNYLYPIVSGLNVIPLQVINQIYAKFGDSAYMSLLSNPYDILDEKIPFLIADKIAKAQCGSASDANRLQAGLLSYIAAQMNAKGDLCIPVTRVKAEFAAYLSTVGCFESTTLTDAQINAAMKALVKAEKMTMENGKDGETYCYLTIFNYFENAIVRDLKTLQTREMMAINTKDAVLSYIQNKKELAQGQRDAVQMALTNTVSILTGGPGTGKTFTVNQIVEAVQTLSPDSTICLLAPTGKAAKRMGELTGMDAMTIHRKLKLTESVETESAEKIEENFVIVDECSMVDASLFYHLLHGLSENTRLLLVGDVDQLPSIGSGLILRDLIDSGKVETTRLTQIFRQAEESQIIMNAHKLIEGDAAGISFDDAKTDMQFTETADANEIFNLMLDKIENAIHGNAQNIRNIVYLSPMHKGLIGTDNMNRAIQELVNPKKNGVKELEWTMVKKNGQELKQVLRENDRVMQLRNNSEKDVMNGETGFVYEVGTAMIENEKGAIQSKDMVIVDYGKGKMVSYYADELNEIELAYAMTIHKSQGSEFAKVFMPIHESQRFMLQRNLVYTAWTRAKEQLVMVGSREELNNAVARVENLVRCSLLKEKIMNQL